MVVMGGTMGRIGRLISITMTHGGAFSRVLRVRTPPALASSHRRSRSVRRRREEWVVVAG
jgi:hypothetical protein